MTPTIIGDSTIYNDDCRVVMASLIARGVQFDSIVTDPPYHLTTVKRFGAEGAAPAIDPTYARMSRGFMGKEWDGGAYQIFCNVGDAKRRDNS